MWTAQLVELRSAAWQTGAATTGYLVLHQSVDHLEVALTTQHAWHGSVTTLGGVPSQIQFGGECSMTCKFS